MMDFIAMFFGAFVASLFGVWLLMWGLNGKAPETQADFNRLGWIALVLALIITASQS